MNGRELILAPSIRSEIIGDRLERWPHKPEIENLSSATFRQRGVLSAAQVVLADIYVG